MNTLRWIKYMSRKKMKQADLVEITGIGKSSMSILIRAVCA